MKVVINDCFGGFGLSKVAYEWLIKEKGWIVTEYNKEGDYKNPKADLVLSNHFSNTYYHVKNEDELRINPDVIEVVETIGKEASGDCAKLKIIEIPDDVEWHISEYDGCEHVAENHQTWC